MEGLQESVKVLSFNAAISSFVSDSRSFRRPIDRCGVRAWKTRKETHTVSSLRFWWFWSDDSDDAQFINPHFGDYKMGRHKIFWNHSISWGGSTFWIFGKLSDFDGFFDWFQFGNSSGNSKSKELELLGLFGWSTFRGKISTSNILRIEANNSMTPWTWRLADALVSQNSQR